MSGPTWKAQTRVPFLLDSWYHVQRISDKICHGRWYYFGSMLWIEKPRRNIMNCMRCVHVSFFIY